MNARDRMMTETLVLSELYDGVLALTMNRGAKRNALDTNLTADLIAALQDAESSDDIRVVTITGTGPSFCAGADLKEFESGDEDGSGNEKRSTLYAALYDLIPAMSKPVIAVVNGYALGGGCALLLSCDMAIASAGASLGYPEIRFGMVGRGVLPPLVRTVGPKPAFDLLVSGRRIDADEALRLGMINRIVPAEKLRDSANEIAAEIASYPPDAVQATKQHLLQVADMNLADGLDYVRSRIKV